MDGWFLRLVVSLYRALGGSLDRYRGLLPEPVLSVVTGQVLHGLIYLAAKSIMHRDVKPSNILVNSNGQIKLCDFGNGQGLDVFRLKYASGVSRELEASVTQTYVGSNAYMAPERVLHQTYDVKADVWSVGMSVVELATGVLPFEERNALTALELMQCIVYEQPPTLVGTNFSNEAQDFVAQ